MRGRLSRIAMVVACAVVVGVGAGSSPVLAQPKPVQPAAKPKPFDVCKGLTGANAATKVEACTEAHKEG